MYNLGFVNTVHLHKFVFLFENSIILTPKFIVKIVNLYSTNIYHCAAYLTCSLLVSDYLLVGYVDSFNLRWKYYRITVGLKSLGFPYFVGLDATWVYLRSNPSPKMGLLKLPKLLMPHLLNPFVAAINGFYLHQFRTDQNRIKAARFERTRFY